MGNKSALYYNHTALKEDIIYSFISEFKFFPNAFGHQINDPNACCSDRIIGDFELIYVIGGDSFINVDEKKYKCQEGDILLIPPFTRHNINTTNENPHNNYWLHFDIYPFYKYKNFINAILPDDEFKISTNIKNKLLPLYTTLEHEYELKNPGYKIYFNFILTVIITELLRYNIFALGNNYIESNYSVAKHKDESIINKCIDFIGKNINKPIMTTDLCNEVHVSESYIYKAFFNVIGLSPNTCVQFMRVKEAEKLIKTEDLSFKQISEYLGFSSPYYFSKVFKKYYGVSPKEYLETNI